ncbi:MAG: YqgE/AlgH family protein [Gammaproteobacteria bacterium]
MKRIVVVLLACFGFGNSLAQEPSTGSFLVATDSLRDPSFSETVILILHYASDGALGIAVNRPTWVDAADTFPDAEYLDNYSGNVFYGGPVARSNLVALLRLEPSDDLDLQPIVDNVYVTADPEFLIDLVSAEETDQRLRLFAGHAAWEGGQLEREIEAGSWRVVPAAANQIFAAEPLRLWTDLNAPQSELMVSTSSAAETIAPN